MEKSAALSALRLQNLKRQQFSGMPLQYIGKVTELRHLMFNIKQRPTPTGERCQPILILLPFPAFRAPLTICSGYKVFAMVRTQEIIRLHQVSVLCPVLQPAHPTTFALAEMIHFRSIYQASLINGNLIPPA